MAHDGCREVAWKGQAFPYLMHRPDSRSHKYGQAQSTAETAQPTTEVLKAAATGTWNGPAPAGQLDKAQHGKAVPAPEASARPVPRDVRVSSTRIGMVITQAADVASARAAGAGSALVPCDKSLCSDDADSAAGDDKLPRGTLMLHEDVGTAAGKKILIVLASGLTSESLYSAWAAAEACMGCAGAQHLGLKDATLAQVESVLAAAGANAKPVCNIVELHPQHSQRKLVGTCMRKGVQCITHSAAPSALLDGSSKAASVVAKVAADTQQSQQAVLYKWSMLRGVPVVLAGGEDAVNARACFSWSLDEERGKALLDGLDGQL